MEWLEMAVVVGSVCDGVCAMVVEGSWMEIKVLTRVGWLPVGLYHP